MAFQILFITEGDAINPAAEIQFDHQRLCIVRFSPAGAPELEFVQDLYVGGDVAMIFPFEEFMDTLRIALDDLVAWRQNLEELDR